MKTIFADTYYFLALGNEDDQGHLQAVTYATSYSGRILTTEWILTEVGDALASPDQRDRFLALLELIREDANSLVIEASHALFERGIALYAQRPDKGWSLTDCISFVVMAEYEIADALTADHHFEQAGFRAVLRVSDS